LEIRFVKCRLAQILTVLFVLTCASAFSQSFDQILGNFAQRRSGVCVIYGHVLAVAEVDPASVDNAVRKVFGGWMVMFPDGRRTYVAQEDIDKSLAAQFSSGEPDNKLTILSMALSMRSGGYKRDTGMLDYGPVLDFGKFMGSGNWTGYGNDSGPDRTLAKGFERLARETGPDGNVRIPATIGFGSLDEKSLPKYAAKAKEYKLVSDHDFSMCGYNAKTKCARLRNPHNPKVVLEVPVDFLCKIPCGTDFLEKSPAK
jgi:hypothetical protein